MLEKCQSGLIRATDLYRNWMRYGAIITTLASKFPEINFVSMEREKSVMYKVLDKVKELNLTNLKMICNDAIELNEYFNDGEVSRIYLNFSDPWPKKRHAKRRLTYHTF